MKSYFSVMSQSIVTTHYISSETFILNSAPYALDAVCNPQTYEKIYALATGPYYQSGGYNYDMLKHELKYGHVL